MKILYRIIIAALIVLNSSLYLGSSNSPNVEASRVDFQDSSKEIFPEFIAQLEPEALVHKFQAGVKQGGEYQDGFEAANVPMIEAIDKAMARCMAFFATQPLPWEEDSNEEQTSTFDASKEYSPVDMCEQKEYYSEVLSQGPTTLIEIEDKAREYSERRQIDFERCLKTMTTMASAYNSALKLDKESEHIEENIDETLDRLKEEIKILNENLRLVSQIPRIYTQQDCS